MANPASPTDASGYRLGMLVHKVSTTLTAVLWRAIGKASTASATDVGWGGVATHLEDEAAVVADASNAKPVVLIGGQRGLHVTVSAAGDVSAIQVDTLGAVLVNPSTAAAAALADATANPTTAHVAADLMTFNGTTWDRLRIPIGAALADAYANPTTTHLANDQMIFNGTTWDRQRSNMQVTLLTSASRTTTQTGADTVNYNHRGIKVTLDMTVVGTGSVTLSIQEKDPTSGKYTSLLDSAAITTNITTILTVYPGLTAVANSVATQVLPRDFRIVVTANNANAATYSVGYALLV